MTNDNICKKIRVDNVTLAYSIRVLDVTGLARITSRSITDVAVSVTARCHKQSHPHESIELCH